MSGGDADGSVGETMVPSWELVSLGETKPVKKLLLKSAAAVAESIYFREVLGACVVPLVGWYKIGGGIQAFLRDALQLESV